ncbi:MAG: response regulator [Planctomycetales bacterium]
MLRLKPSVLIVDELEETREVLQTVLERHGVDAMTTGEVEQGLRLAREHHPDLIVLDLEMESSDDAEVRQGFEEETIAQSKPLVVLGTARRNMPVGGQFVAKPYHYGALVRKIEQLLEHSTARP